MKIDFDFVIIYKKYHLFKNNKSINYYNLKF